MKKAVDKALHSVFGGKDFERIVMEKGVLLTLMDVSRQTYPKETIMILEGRVVRKELRISGVLFEQYDANEWSAHIELYHLPTSSAAVGTFHSHPGPSNRPSNADVHLFGKFGLVHFIARVPYREQDFACYDKAGRRLPFFVV